MNEKTWSTKDTPAAVIAKLYNYGYKLVGHAGKHNFDTEYDFYSVLIRFFIIIKLLSNAQ